MGVETNKKASKLGLERECLSHTEQRFTEFLLGHAIHVYNYYAFQSFWSKIVQFVWNFQTESLLINDIAMAMCSLLLKVKFNSSDDYGDANNVLTF